MSRFSARIGGVCHAVTLLSSESASHPGVPASPEIPSTAFRLKDLDTGREYIVDEAAKHEYPSYNYVRLTVCG